MDYKPILEAIAQLGFPIVITLGLIFWLGRYAFPKVTEMIGKLIGDFRAEMESERKFHGEQIKLILDTGRAEHQEIKELIRNGRKGDGG